MADNTTMTVGEKSFCLNKNWYICKVEITEPSYSRLGSNIYHFGDKRLRIKLCMVTLGIQVKDKYNTISLSNPFHAYEHIFILVISSHFTNFSFRITYFAH